MKKLVETSEMEGNVAEAACREEWDKVKDLVDRGGDVNITYDIGRTALHHAANRSNVEMCKFLLDRGADVAARDEYGNMPIERAISSRDPTSLDVVRLLLTDVTVNAGNDNGERPLHLAARKQFVDLVQLLVDHDADTNVVDKDGYTPLHDANRFGGDDPAVSKILLKFEAKVDAANRNGDQPLHLACRNSKIKSARLLLSNGASARASNNDGKTPLHCAAGGSTLRSEFCDILLDRDADIDVADEDGNQPLHIACTHNKVEIAKSLISHGADVAAVNGQNVSPFQLALPDFCIALYKAGLTSKQVEDICKGLNY